MFINIVWLFLGLAVFFVIATTAIPLVLMVLSHRVRRVGRSRH